MATEQGFPVSCFANDLSHDVDNVCQSILACLDHGQPGVYIWGGESTVRLPEAPGRGGRNQHLALLLAQALAGRTDVGVLVAATDGSDGETDAAGAIVDGATIARGQAAGLNVEDSIRQADSGHFLAASGDLFATGPTGTNVMDLVIALKRAV